MVILRLYDTVDGQEKAIPLPIEDADAYRVHKYNGADTLNFEIQRNNPLYSKISEEVKIEGFNNRFIVKKIDEHSDFVVVECELDYDDFKVDIFKDYRKTNQTIVNIMTDILPTGWQVNYGTGVDVTQRRTVEESDGQAFKLATPYNMLDAITSAYEVVFNFDVINKILYVINPESYTASGEFIMKDLNLTDLGFNGDSSNFITRLYAYGKKDESTGEYVTIESVNDGKEYVSNFQYSDKIVCGTWVDERYTVPINLYNAAVDKLAELSKPQRSYTCNVINFNEDIWLYKVVTLVDPDRGTRVNHRVVEFVEYANHKLDTCTLSSMPPSIMRIVNDTKKDTIDEINRAKVGIQQLVDEKTQQLSDTITGSKGGHFKWILDADGNPEELVNLYDTDNINTAQKVWRWNAGGLGHSNNGYNGTYGLALTKDGEINASMITTGVLNAGIIRAGIIQDVQGNNSWNLETGALTMKSGSINIANKFTVSTSGKMTATGADIEGNISVGGSNNTKGTINVYDANGNLVGGINNTELYSKHPTSGNKVSLNAAQITFLEGVTKIATIGYYPRGSVANALTIKTLASRGFALKFESENTEYTPVDIGQDLLSIWGGVLNVSRTEWKRVRIDNGGTASTVCIPEAINPDGSVSSWYTLELYGGVLYNKQ